MLCEQERSRDVVAAAVVDVDVDVISDFVVSIFQVFSRGECTLARLCICTFLFCLVTRKGGWEEDVNSLWLN